ncbi:MAG: 4Fe-4S dicluster domain-containing protein [Clostridium sp.]|nr:4Fe-4S dicluster domain-containing protein [Clostridium sp.]
MFQFETQLKKLKHEVLTEVARLAKEDKLSLEAIDKIPYKIIKGDKAMYRCCVYKERAIVLERAKLASGYLSNGDNVNDELIDIRENDQIIYVIEAACDRCPINKYSITDSCRGCLAHKCDEACNFGAITYVAGRAYINQELCKECGMCKKACPYDAVSEVMRPCKRVCPTGALDINDLDRRAIIKEEICVNCGSCMTACPFGAISDKSLIVPVAKRLARGRKMYAIVAPAITGQFGPKVSYGKIKSAIKKLGFLEMVEAACGADAVTIHESNEFIERINNGDSYMTNSCCPGFLNFIDKTMPSEKERVSGTVSPMIATARYIKSKDEGAKVVFIGPCTAKKNEAVRSSVKGAVDYVLTFEELLALLEAFDVNILECEDEVVDDASIFGRGFGVHGGLTEAIENYISSKEINVNFIPVKASGGVEIKKIMTMAKMGRLQGNFIEGMMCQGGCINGAGTIATPFKSKSIFSKINAQGSIKAVIENKKLSEFEALNLERK